MTLSIMGRPWDVYLAQNQVANRVALDTANTGIKMSVARNKHEALERFFSWAGYVVLAIGIPALLEQFLSKRWGKQLRTAAQGNPVKLPYNLIEHHAFKELQHSPTEATLAKHGITLKELKNFYGLNKISDLTPTMVKKLRWMKPAIMLVDFSLAASKGIIIYRFRNWFTKKNSKKSGFSGEFNYTNEQYRQQKTEPFEKTKALRKKLSVGIGYGMALGLPLLVFHSLRSKTTRGVAGFMKRHLRKINYTDAIFMSRWLIFYQSMFGYDIQKLLAARDGHELREDVIELAIYNAMYFGGDAAISGWLANRLQKTLPKGHLQGVSLTEPVKVFGQTIQKAVPYQEMYRKLNDATHPAYKAAKKIFFTGFIGSAIGLAGFTLLNYQYTRHKAQKQQAVLTIPLFSRC